ncbi:MAG: DNA replication and repair protein RecF [Thermaurantimonas aggregans]|nr:DNA replication and repair protein RecF [Thermaurantimonas aggregans]MCX8149717.1 DNA replication and repair protein RecF [Thermaurantimonas aggregans]
MSQLLLLSLNVLNFKNWEEVSLNFSPSINCFLGANGVGKTNLLDAIHYLCITKSFLTNTDAQAMKHGADFFMVKGLFTRAEQEEEILLSLRKNDKKLLKRNDVEYQKLSDHIGLLPVVVISPLDTNLIYEGSKERRKVTDLILSLADSHYLHQLIRYNRLLQQRNTYLKETVPLRKCSLEILELYTEQMEPLAEYIYSVRSQFWEKTAKWLSEFYSQIANSTEDISVAYQSDLAQGNLAAMLREATARDMDVLYTTKGIHKDDIDMRINGFPLKKFGSQGQQKSYLIALKLAMYAVLREKTGMPPILLFDDIFDKLDRNRTANVIRLVRDMNFGQIFLSDTDPERSVQIANQFHGNARFFHIHSDQKIHIE